MISLEKMKTATGFMTSIQWIRGKIKYLNACDILVIMTVYTQASTPTPQEEALLARMCGGDAIRESDMANQAEIGRLERNGHKNLVGLGPEEIREYLRFMVGENVGVIKITKGDSGITSGIIGTVEKNGVFNRRYVVRDHHSRVQPEIDVEEEVLSGRYGFFSVV